MLKISFGQDLGFGPHHVGFCANTDAAPSRWDGAVTSDLALALLQEIAGSAGQL